MPQGNKADRAGWNSGGRLLSREQKEGLSVGVSLKETPETMREQIMCKAGGERGSSELRLHVLGTRKTSKETS